MRCEILSNILPNSTTFAKRVGNIKPFVVTCAIVFVALAALATFSLFYKTPPQNFIGKGLYLTSSERIVFWVISGVGLSLCTTFFIMKKFAKQTFPEIKNRLNLKEYTNIEEPDGTLYIGKHGNGEIEEIFVVNRRYSNRSDRPSLLVEILDRSSVVGRALQPFRGYTRVALNP